MDVVLLLCDYAEALNGKLYVMGGGWSVLFAANQPVTTAVAALVSVPWDRTNLLHRVRLELLTGDGEPVEIEGQNVLIEGEFEVGRPPGVKPGTAFNTPFVWNFNGLALDAGSYEWKLAINDEPVASRPFVVSPPPPGPGGHFEPPAV